MLSKRGVMGLPLLAGALAIGFLSAEPAPAANGKEAAGFGAFAERCNAQAVPGAIPGLELDRAERVAAGSAAVAGGQRLRAPALQGVLLPEHCLLAGSFEKRVGAGRKPYAIGFELRVPVNWNGRLLFTGGGAFKGSVDVAFGAPVTSGSTKLALADGFAVVTSDSGHSGADAAFTTDQLARLNYAYASIGKVVRVAKTLVRDMTHREPQRTYFSGCSNGGREAMQAALRFPEEFDGVISANPAIDFSGDSLSKWNSINAYAKAAPRASDGTTQPWLALTNADWSLLSRKIVDQCDAADGLRDGMIFDQKACSFSPRILECRPGETSECLSAAKVQAVEEAFHGPMSGGGREVAYPWTYDASVGTAEWLSGQGGYVAASGEVIGRDNRLPNAVLTELFRYPRVTPETVMTERPEETRAAMREMEALVNATQTQLSTFSAKGAKMLLVHGWSDSRLPPAGLVRWYERLQRDTRQADGEQAESFARLFMVPGMLHCGGGSSLDDFDALKALIDWVENGRPPESFVARGNLFPGISRPICAWPHVARYDGKGAPSAASSFVCR